MNAENGSDPARTDSLLLQEFKASNSEKAFRELVQKYTGFVFGVACRRVSNPSTAEEVTQNVFLALARKAHWLRADPILAGWLHRCTVMESARVLRREHRYQRKMKAYSEYARCEGHGQSPWKEVLEVLDEAIDALSPLDRSVLLMRFFECRTARETGSALGKSEEATQKQAERALEKLSGIMRRKGVLISSGILASGLTAELAQAAPAGLALSIFNNTLAAIPAASPNPFTLKTLEFMKQTQLALVVGLAAMVPLVWLWHENRGLRTEVARLTDQVAQISKPAPATGTAQNQRAKLRAGISRAPSDPVSVPDTHPEFDAASAWRAALVEPDPVQRARRVAELLARLTSESAPPIAQVFQDLEKSGLRFDSEARLFYRAWGKLNGAAAVAYARQTNQTSTATSNRSINSMELQSALAGWASVSPLEARGWAETLPEGEEKERVINGLLDGWSLVDFWAASAYAVSRPVSAAREQFRALLLERALASGGVPAAQQWFFSIPEDETNASYRRRAFREVVGAMLYRDPTAAAEWIAQLGAQSYSKDGIAISSTAAKLAQTAPTEALRWLDSLSGFETKSLRNGAVATMQQWAGTDLSTAESWLNQNPNHPLYDSLVEGLAQTLLQSNPDKAFEWAKNIRDETARTQAIEGLTARQRAGSASFYYGTRPGFGGASAPGSPSSTTLAVPQGQSLRITTP